MQADCYHGEIEASDHRWRTVTGGGDRSFGFGTIDSLASAQKPMGLLETCIEVSGYLYGAR